MPSRVNRPSRSCGFFRTVAFLSTLGLIALVFAPPVWSEDLTLTTYYPAPFGVYDTLVAEKLVDYNSSNYHVPPVAGADWFVDPAGAAGLSGTFRATVGIGTNNPNQDAKLHVVGIPGTNAWSTAGLFSMDLSNANAFGSQLTLQNAGPLGAAIRLSFTDGADVMSQIVSARNGSTNGGYLAFRTRNGVGIPERLRITENGDVGVGTENPLGRLQVQSKSNPNVGTLITSWGPNEDSYLRGGTTAAKLHLGDVLTDTILLGESGGTKVGVGGAMQTQVAFSQVGANLLGGPDYWNAFPYSDNNVYITGETIFVRGGNRQNGKERLRITPDGYLGLGTQTPALRLAFPNVDTTVAAEGITWYGPDWAHYGIYRMPGPWVAPFYQPLKIAWGGGISLDAGGSPSVINAVKITPGNNLYVEAGGLGVGVMPDYPTYPFEVNGRVRVHKGSAASAGIWFAHDQVPQPLLAFVGMANDNLVGFYGSDGADWGLVMNTRNGYVGIRNMTPLHPLHVNGCVEASNIPCNSDIRLKQAIQPLSHPLEKVSQIRGISYQWAQPDPAEAGHPRHIGVIAQDVERVFPELVIPSGQGDYKGVNYSALTAVLLEAIKELQAKHEAAFQELRATNAQLQQRLEALEQRLPATSSQQSSP